MLETTLFFRLDIRFCASMKREKQAITLLMTKAFFFPCGMISKSLGYCFFHVVTAHTERISSNKSQYSRNISGHWKYTGNIPHDGNDDTMKE